MNTARASSLLLLTCAVSAAPMQMAFTQTASSPTHRPPPPALAPSYSKLPLSFEANQGQTDPQVKFLSRGQGYSLFLTDSAAVLALSRPNPASHTLRNGRPSLTQKTKPSQSDVVRMELAGSNPAAHVAGAEQLPGIANYFLGKDPSSWHTNVPTYAKVKYSSVYPGVDLVYYGNQHQLEYDFLVAPNANPKQVRLHFAGAKKLSIKPDGDLIVAARHGEVAFHKPAVYQTVNGQRHAVEGRFTLLAGNKVGFQLGNYDHSQELVIDPVLVYSTYLGGSGYKPDIYSGTYGDFASGIAVDASGNAYVTGMAWSADFPVTAKAYLQTNLGLEATVNDEFSDLGGIAFVTKLNPSGTALIYSTYLGGYSESYASAIAVGADGSAYIAGASDPDFPTTEGAFQPYSHFQDVDYNAFYSTGTNAFVTKLSASGARLIYSTFLGGGFTDAANAIAVDGSGNAYVTGMATSSDFPITSGSVQTVNGAAPEDQSPYGNYGSSAFVTKLNAAGSALVYSTFLGGYDNVSSYTLLQDQGFAIAVDKLGDAYVTGDTYSPNFPLTGNAFQKVNNGFGNGSNKFGSNAFFAELNPSGSALLYSTYLGGKDDLLDYPATGDAGTGIAVDGSGYAYVTGPTSSSDFPVTPGALQEETKSATSFVAKFDLSQPALTYSTYLGTDRTYATAIATDGLGNAYVTGCASSGLPVTGNAFQAVSNSEWSNAFLTELNASGSAVAYSSYLGGTNGTAYSGVFCGTQSGGKPGAGGFETGTALALDAAGDVYIAGTTNSVDFPATNDAFQKQNKASTNGFITKFDLSQNPTITDTTIALTSDWPNGSDPGQLIAFLAAVKSINLSSIPSGNVVFSVDGVAQQTSPLLHDGHAVYYSNSLTPGTHQVTAVYQGNAQYAVSSENLTQTILNQAITPTILPPGGTYRTVNAVISTPTPNAAIYYTTDGKVPSTSSHRYTAPIPIDISGVIKAIAVADGGPASYTATSKYVLAPAAITTTTSLRVSAVTPYYGGEQMTLTAFVNFASGPTLQGTQGNVIFMDGPNVIQSSPLFIESNALFEGRSSITAYIGVEGQIGGHSITAFYTGIPANPLVPYPGAAASQSPVVVVAVNP